MNISKSFTRMADHTAIAAGHPATFIVCFALVIGWAVTGPFFGFSDTWQMVINTSTTIVTFLMVFLLQTTQNRDGAAIQAKLDELIRASAAQNSFIGIDHLTESELKEIRAKCEARAGRSRQGPGSDEDDERQASDAPALEMARTGA